MAQLQRHVAALALFVAVVGVSHPATHLSRKWKCKCGARARLPHTRTYVLQAGCKSASLMASGAGSNLGCASNSALYMHA